MGLTTGERTALRWLLVVVVTGAGSHLFRHWRYSAEATPASSESLSRHLLAVDSAQRHSRLPRGGRSKSPRGRASSRAGSGSAGGAGRPARAPSIAHVPTLAPVDLDQADSAMLERLPRIGPALAARIVADRQAHGPFGSLRALQRVRGIGSKLAGAIEAHVTFSGTPRPSSVQR